MSEIASSVVLLVEPSRARALERGEETVVAAEVRQAAECGGGLAGGSLEKA